MATVEEVLEYLKQQVDLYVMSPYDYDGSAAWEAAERLADDIKREIDGILDSLRGVHDGS